jgi:preprotein translocase SecE subunit
VAKTASGNSGGSGGKGGRKSPVPPPSGKSTPPAQFVRECISELRKVQWPTGPQVVQGTIVVGFVTATIAIYLALVDYVAVRLIAQLDKLLA